MAKHAPRTPPPAGIDAIRSRIKAAGLRCTAARLAVLEHMHAASGPLSHAEVSEALGHRNFDRVTIYRNLTELAEAGILSRVEVGDHVWRFEVTRAGHGRTRADDHPHFLCTSCGEVSCLDDLQVALTPKPGQRGRNAGRFSGGRRPAIGSVR